MTKTQPEKISRLMLSAALFTQAVPEHFRSLSGAEMLAQRDKILKAVPASILCRKLFDHHASLSKTIVVLKQA